jgi:iron(III) transport system permease protein
LIKRSQSRFAGLLSWVVLLPIAIPATTIGIGLISVWNRAYVDSIYGSSLIIILGYVARFIPFSVIICSSGLAQLSHHLEETAVLAGSSFYNLQKKIVVPLLNHNLFTVLFIIFILSLGELGTTLLVIPPGRETISIKIYNLMHYGADQLVAALCLILVGIILGISGIFLVWYRKMGGEYREII